MNFTFINREGEFADIANFPIENTTARVRFRSTTSNEVKSYRISPNDGYVLHDREYDIIEYDIDPITGEVIEISRRLGYRTTMASCGYNYDFTATTITDDNGVTHTAYGSRQFFAVPADSVPENQIYDITNPPEIM